MIAAIVLCAALSQQAPEWVDEVVLQRVNDTTKVGFLHVKKCKPKGDVNEDGVVDVKDVEYLIEFLFADGPPPLCSADVNKDGVVDARDVFYLINYLFADGPKPK